MEDPKSLTGTPDALAEFNTLRMLAADPHLSQRELAEALGLSLGKTHYVLRALLEKGLVKIENFRRSNHKLAYAYLLTPSGVTAKSRLTRQFLVNKMRQFEALQHEIENLRREAERETSARAASSAVDSQAGAARLQKPARPTTHVGAKASEDIHHER